MPIPSSMGTGHDSFPAAFFHQDDGGSLRGDLRVCIDNQSDEDEGNGRLLTSPGAPTAKDEFAGGPSPAKRHG